MDLHFATKQFKVLAKKLTEQDDLRKAEIAIKHIERQKTIAKTETYPYFQETITKRKLRVENSLNELMLGNFDDVTVAERLDAISEDLRSLRRFFGSSTMFLKPFEVRMGQKSIEELENRYTRLAKQFLPRQKFAFTSRKAIAESKIQSMKVEDVLKDGEIVSNLPVDYDYVSYSTGFAHKSGENLSLEGDDIKLKDVNLSHLEGCEVTLRGSPGLLTVTSLNKCKVFSGPVATSVFIENCSECVFVVACQQLRIHDSNDCEFRIHVTSRAVIEGTKAVGFAPYDWSYDGIEADFQTSKLDRKKNNWDCVDDFNWLACDKPSPNWRRLTDEENKTSETDGTEP